MSEPAAPLFDFREFTHRTGHYRQLIRDFAAGAPFRSAAVDELVLDDDFHRRPLRPEDLDFLTFRQPVKAATVSQLPALASQRTLICLYELLRAVPPAGADSRRLAAFAEFSRESNRVLAAQLLPFLESYAFEYLSQSSSAAPPPAANARYLKDLYNDECHGWQQLFETLGTAGYLQEGLRFILIQRSCLAPSRRRALADARARGHFEQWPSQSASRLEPTAAEQDALQQLATLLGVNRRQHAYWQFYLPTSLSKCNLLYALGRRPEHSFAFYGALYAARVEELAFATALAGSCPHIAPAPGANPHAQLETLLRSVESLLEHLGLEYGAAAVSQVGQGLAAAGTLSERGRWDLGEQLQWLSSINQYCEYARQISRRIDAECPDIDRDTFVEPRDMCSTTHVHNDHRLVTIESGIMHFWGNLDMRLELREGDRVLIPAGRLHGSTVLSDECTYHQPIIPDAWIQELRRTKAAPLIHAVHSNHALNDVRNRY